MHVVYISDRLTIPLTIHIFITMTCTEATINHKLDIHSHVHCKHIMQNAQYP